MEDIMRKCLEEMNKTYRDHVQKMKDGFGVKTKQYKALGKQIEINNAFVSKHANDVQQVLEEHRAAIIDEKNTEYRKLRSAQEAWKSELEFIYAKNNFNSPILTLDSGG